MRAVCPHTPGSGMLKEHKASQWLVELRLRTEGPVGTRVARGTPDKRTAPHPPDSVLRVEVSHRGLCDRRGLEIQSYVSIQ